MKIKIKHTFKRVGRKVSNIAFKVYRRSFMASSTRNMIAIVILFTIGIGIYGHFYWEDTYKQFIATVAGVLSALFVGALVHIISVSFEDRHKVTEDFSVISKIYSEEDLKQTLTFIDGTKVEFAYKGVTKLIDKVHITDNNDKLYIPTEVMASNYVKLFSAHRGSYKHNFTTVRADELLANEDGSLSMITSRSNYFNHLISNRVMDFPFAKSLTLRSLYEPGPNITPLKQSVFSNHLGIIGIIKTIDGYYMINRRSNTGSTSKSLLVSPIAFGLKAEIRDKVDDSYIKNKIIDKVNSRLNKDTNNNYVSNIIQVGFGRDVYEAGKPHLFYLVNVSLTKDEYLGLFYSCNTIKRSIDYDSKTYGIRAAGISYLNGFLKVTHANSKDKVKIHLMKGETNLLMNLKCLIELNLFE